MDTAAEVALVVEDWEEEADDAVVFAAEEAEEREDVDGSALPSDDP